MNDEQLKRQVIQRLAEEGVTKTHDPWAALQSRLGQRQAGSVRGLVALRIAVVVVTCLLVAGAVFFTTPAGHAIAQDILSLFTRSGQDLRPLPAGQVQEAPRATVTPVPTRIVGLLPATAVATQRFVTSTPPATQAESGILPGLTIVAAQQLVDFPILELSSLPPGYALSEVAYLPESQAVQQMYTYTPYQAGEVFIFTQQAIAPTDQVGQSAEVSQLRIGDIPVERVVGAWFNAAGAASEQWQTDAPVYTYRWQTGAIYYTLQFLVGDTFSPAYLSPEEMQAMVEIALEVRVAFPTRLNPYRLPDLGAVEAAAGFHVLAPTLLPEGFIFERGVYEPESPRAVLIYKPQASSRAITGASLVIFEIPMASAQPLATFEGFPDDAVQQVQVGSFPATLVIGAMEDGVYLPEAGLALYWRTEALQITLSFSVSSGYPARLDVDSFLAIAESMQ